MRLGPDDPEDGGSQWLDDDDEEFKTAVRAVFPAIKFIDCHTDDWNIVMTYELHRNLPFNSNKRIRFYRNPTGQSFIEFSCYRASTTKTMNDLIAMICNSGWTPCEKDYMFPPMDSPLHFEKDPTHD